MIQVKKNQDGERNVQHEIVKLCVTIFGISLSKPDSEDT